MTRYQNELDAATAAVRLASTVCQTVQQSKNLDNTKLDKQDRSPVTIADFAAQALVCNILQQTFPNDPIVGEEDSSQLKQPESTDIRKQVVEHVNNALAQSADETTVMDWIDRGNADGSTNRYWTLDPIDGTKGFLRGQQYAIALALIENGQVVAGALACPNLPVTEGSNQTGIIMTAAIDTPSKQFSLTDNTNAQTITVADIRQPSDARVCESVESGHSNQSDSAKIAQLLGITAQSVRLDSQAKYAVVARGQASIYLRLPTRADYREKIWDHAAGLIVTQQAGGKVTDVNGKPLDFTQGPTFKQNRGVIATNGHIHDQVIEAVQKILNS